MRKRKNKGRAYSGRKLSKAALIIIAIAVYILVLAAGAGFIILVPFFGEREELLNLAKNRGEYTITHFTDYTESTYGTEYYLFNEYGALITSDHLYLATQESAELKSQVSSLLASNSSYSLTVLGRSTSNARTVIIAGRCIYAPSGRRFVSFIIRNLTDINITIATFGGIFTLLYIIGVALIAFIGKQHNDLMILNRDLISNTSHELKTPITSIKAMGELLYDGMYKSDEDIKRYSQTIIRESTNLSDLVQEILNLAKLQSHKAEFRKEVCYAEGIFTPVIDRYFMMGSDLGIDIDVSELALSALPPLYTDQEQINRVWRVILDNAMKFAGKGGQVRISQKAGNDKVTFCISDNGPGIPKESIKRVFERFYKSDVTHNSQGSGLGLAIAHEIILGLGEKIWVESVEGEGSSFYFTVSYH